MDEREKWRAVEECDAEYDGKFFYAVKSTGVYCRPSCKSKTPRPENVRYFATRAEAEAAGFRPCKRCRPDLAEYDPDAETAERARELIELHFADAGELRDALAGIGLSRAQLTRIFERRFDMPIKQYADRVRLERAKALLDAGSSVTDAASAVGMGSAALAAFFRKHSGMPPSEYAAKSAAEGASCVVASPVGLLRLTESGLGITGIAFVREGAQSETRGEFLPEAKRQLDEYFAGKRREFEFPLDMRGTEFQKRVWAELRRIPYGETRSYQEIAAALGNAKASRAVGMANNRNPIVIAVPCHRVVGKDGSLVGYAGGLDRKKYLLELEGVHG